MLPTEVKRPRRERTPEEARAALERLCARAEKCESDARRLMRGWGVAAADAERVVTQLVAARFIDDGRYASAFVREKLSLSGWGLYKIRAALQRKGIAREHIEAALAAADGTDMGERLRERLERKLRTIRAATPYERKNKLIRYGLSLGYEYDTVLDTAGRLIRDIDEACDEF